MFPLPFSATVRYRGQRVSLSTLRKDKPRPLWQEVRSAMGLLRRASIAEATRLRATTTYLYGNCCTDTSLWLGVVHPFEHTDSIARYLRAIQSDSQLVKRRGLATCAALRHRVYAAGLAARHDISAARTYLYGRCHTDRCLFPVVPASSLPARCTLTHSSGAARAVC